MAEKTKLRLGYSDMEKSFHPSWDFFYKTLSEEYDVEIDYEHPDILISSMCGYKHLRFLEQDITKVYTTIENIAPDLNTFDYAFSFVRDSMSGRNMYSPLTSFEPIIPMPDREAALNRKFAIFLASHDAMGRGAAMRRDFTQYLIDHYKPVDCPGRVLHNIDIEQLSKRYDNDWRTSKIHVLASYKFNIAFENSSTDGYITEKLTDPLQACTVPIYWGSAGNPAPFPKEAMICANDYPDFAALVARIREVDENDELYLSILRANPLFDKNFQAAAARRHQERKAFLKRIAAEALQRSTCGELMRTDRCNPIFSNAHKIQKALHKCPATGDASPMQFVVNNLKHFYFLRPGAMRKVCPIGQLIRRPDKNTPWA